MVLADVLHCADGLMALDSEKCIHVTNVDWVPAKRWALRTGW